MGFVKRTSFGSTITGMNSRSTRMDMMVPKTLKLCTTKAVVHCLNFAPSSSGATETIKGEMRYSSSILKMRPTQLRMMVASVSSMTKQVKNRIR